MTKNAQQALRYLIQQYIPNIRFCLICNYISRIDSALQNEFIRLRFCQLPQSDIYKFLNNIKEKENLHIEEHQLVSVQQLFKSDIRSMINFIQSNHESFMSESFMNYIITENLWETIIHNIKTISDIKSLVRDIKQKAIKYNFENKDLIIDFISYLVENKEYTHSKKWLQFFKFIVHNIDTKANYLYFYFFATLRELYKSL